MPKIDWPNNSKLVLSFVENYEEGAEKNIEDGDSTPESIGEMQKGIKTPIRDLIIESIFKYGSRVGVWRLIDLFDKYEIKSAYFASALYVACVMENDDVTQKDLAEAAGVTEVTIRNRYKGLKDAMKI